ncbi:MAG: Hpt domain-containing protein, partial [Thermosynechococcus sp. Uc]|uniref:Hpt domain-containing protein n=1 Tax=Thermosynechococcus sp. Uc TaxID=3034853 RepID=UPI00259D4947
MAAAGPDELIRLQFLEEAQDYLQTIEAGILQLSHQPTVMDSVLRAAHSIKGGAAMMGFMSLSELAHRLEDFFKILKSRPCDDVTVQHLLLQAADQLQVMITLHRQGVEPNEGWWRTQVEPILNELQGRLGDVTVEDDLALLSGDDGQQVRVVLFETEVEACLQRLETVLQTPGQPCLKEELAIAAQELEGLGQMLELPQFAEFCASVSAYLEQPNCDVSKAGAHIVQQWRRCQALVITGQLEALPTRLETPETDDAKEDEEQTIIDLPLATLNQELGVEDFASADVESFSFADLLS